jgi:hypothetical protein
MPKGINLVAIDIGDRSVALTSKSPRMSSAFTAEPGSKRREGIEGRFEAPPEAPD